MKTKIFLVILVLTLAIINLILFKNFYNEYIKDNNEIKKIKYTMMQ